MKEKRKQYDDDDGRVVCSMDVEGMRWHDRRVRREERMAARAAQAVPQGEPLTKAQTRQYAFSAALAGLVVVGVFASAWVLFILFCTQVWFK